MTTTTLDIRLNKETQQQLETERELTMARWERFELTDETIAHTDVKNWVSGLDASA